MEAKAVATSGTIRRWLEALHPRDPDGKFRRRGYSVHRGEPVADLNEHVGKPWYGVEDWRDVVVDLPKHYRTADAYDALPEWDDRAKPAYDTLIRELDAQYELLTEGLGVEVETVFEDPYETVEALIEDIRVNRRIKVLATAATPPGHPYLTDEVNDRFRAVHDAFGHAGTGRGFDRHGEEAAYQAHANMFSPTARVALATETRGQNAVLIRNVEVLGVGEFTLQKFALLDEEFTKVTGPIITDDTEDPDGDNAYETGHIHHTTGGRWPHGMTDEEERAWRARRDRARS